MISFFPTIQQLIMAFCGPGKVYKAYKAYRAYKAYAVLH